MNCPTRHLFIINPKSFWNQWKLESICDTIRDFFTVMGPHDYSIEISAFPRDAVDIIHSCARQLPQGTKLRVYAVGGDGILFDCLNGIMNVPDTELAALPYGQANNFFRGFSKKKGSLFHNIGALYKASTIPLDVMRLGNNYGLNFCTVGTVSLAILNTMKIHSTLEAGGSISHWINRRLYRKLYLIGGIPPCFNKKVTRQKYEIIMDNEDFSGNYRNILIANGAYYGSIRPIPSAKPNDGKLDILFTREAGPLRTIAHIPNFTFGTYKKRPHDFFLKQGKEITIRSDYPIYINLDDSAFFDTNITVELLPSAIQFVDVTGQGYLGAAS